MDDVKRLVNTPIEKFETIDILINNSGILGGQTTLYEMSLYCHRCQLKGRGWVDIDDESLILSSQTATEKLDLKRGYSITTHSA